MLLSASLIVVFALAAPAPSASTSSAADPKSASARATSAPPIPDLVDVLRALAAGKESALADLEKIHASRPNDLRVLFALGTAHRLAGKSEPAIRAFRRAAELAKSSDGIHAARPWWGLVRLYRDAGLEKEAAAAVKAFIAVVRKLKGFEKIAKRAEDDLKKPTR